MTVADQLEDVIRLSDELDEFKAKRAAHDAKGDTRDPGKRDSHDALIAEAEAHLEAARALVPAEALEHVDELRAARLKYADALAGIDAKFVPPANLTAASAGGVAHDATVKVKES